jgi:hypothetical protein
MTELLYLTKTRLALLHDVEGGWVHAARDFHTDKIVSTNVCQVVTARCEEAKAAGWIVLGPRNGPSMYSRALWQLTDAGRQVLDEQKQKAS